MKKLFSILFVIAFALVLVACKDDEEGGIEKMYTQETALASGYTSLANEFANPPLEDGKYKIGNLTFDVVDEYNTYYQSEVTEEKFNYLAANSQWNSAMYTNMVDGLVENDKYGAIVGALAVGYKVTENADNTQTYTFQLKEGVQWVDNLTGEPYAEVVADDFVAGLEYVLNPTNGSQTSNIVMGFIKGAEEYFDGLASTTDATDDVAFSTVGIKAVSKYEVAYTLVEPAPYFLSALTYSPFLPVNRQYLSEVGTAFGVTENYILVNGAFRITKHLFENTFEFEKNAYYHDFDHVYVNKVTMRYLPNVSTPATTREWYEAGLIDGFTVSTNDEIGWNKYVKGGENGTGTVQNPADPSTNGVLTIGDVVYAGVWNFDRDTYIYGTDFNQGGATVPAKTDAQKLATKKAILNADFRLGFTFGMDFIARMSAAPDPSMLLMRAYTNRELTAYNGKDYSDYVDEVYNREQGTTGVSLSGAIQKGDAVYNITKAVDYLEDAKTALLADGLTAADFPIKIDYFASRNVTVQAYEKAMFEDLLDEVGPDSTNPIIDIRFNVAPTDAERSEWNWELFNFDLSFGGGWGPDYADPKTYLGTISIGGDFRDNFGLTGADAAAQAAKDAIAEEVFGDFQALYEAAIAITDPTQIDDRYKAMAEAEYNAIFVSALTIPWQTTTSINPVVSKVIPYQKGKAAYGLTSDKLKNIIVVAEAISQEARTQIVALYEEDK
ncbi:MAG TPA: ABC transporter substrate-binding protein [Acholeplasmataceae bacterium]|nr:ABC transporter substrate-binding protein [Acholeplasmataceae bacterium]